MFTRNAIVAAGLTMLLGSANAATVSFDWAKPNPMDAPTNIASPNCNGSTDFCSTAGGALTYSKSGVTVNVTASSSNTSGGSPKVIQDVVGDYGGLGVLTPGETGNVDQVGGGGFLEKLILTFTSSVHLTAFKFFDDHSANPNFTGHKFSLTVDGVSKITDQQPSLSYPVDFFGTVFVIWNPITSQDKNWYLSGLTVETPNPPNEVPEPSTYALMLAGLAMMGFMVRRRTNG
jgi:hypothetical protein